MTQNQLAIPKIQASPHPSNYTGSDPGYYLGWWVIQVSDADPVSTWHRPLFHSPHWNGVCSGLPQQQAYTSSMHGLHLNCVTVD